MIERWQPDLDIDATWLLSATALATINNQQRQRPAVNILSYPILSYPVLSWIIDRHAYGRYATHRKSWSRTDDGMWDVICWCFVGQTEIETETAGSYDHAMTVSPSSPMNENQSVLEYLGMQQMLLTEGMCRIFIFLRRLSKPTTAWHSDRFTFGPAPPGLVAKKWQMSAVFHCNCNWKRRNNLWIFATGSPFPMQSRACRDFWNCNL